MLRATTLRGRAVVDLDSATKLGSLDELILDPDGRRVAGLLVSEGAALLGERKRRLLPAAAVHAVGPDALTVRGGEAVAPDDANLRALPHLGDLTGRKAVSHSGKLLGFISDVLITPEDGRIAGYALDENSPAGRLEGLFGDRAGRRSGYIRADADLRLGPDLVVVPDDGVVWERPDADVHGQPATERQTLAHDRPADAPRAVRWVHPGDTAARSQTWVATEAPHEEGGRLRWEPVHEATTRTVETEPPKRA